MAQIVLLSLFDPPTKSFLVPTRAAVAAARRGGQGRPDGRRAWRASLDGGEHGRTLLNNGISSRQAHRRSPVLAVLALAVLIANGSATRGHAAQVRPSATAVTGIVNEAAARSRLPAAWIHAVIRTESGGDPGAVSPKGAMGLMQLMPATWRALSARHGLGQDPYNPRANVLAGAAYLRELFDQFGEEGFLAAYNAGPGRYADARAGRRKLPAETVAYVARVERAIMASNAAGALVSASTIRDWRAAELFTDPAAQDRSASAADIFVQHHGRVTP